MSVDAAFVPPAPASSTSAGAAPWQNPVRAKLAAGQPVLGATLTVGSAEVAGQIAAMGFDFLWIEMEHSPVTLESVRNMILATRGLPALPITRVPVNELWTAKRALDAGSLGVVFPFCHSAELAQQAADACRYPPRGKRGAGGQAAFRWSAEITACGKNYFDFADEQVLVVVIIESLDGLADVERIAATPGVDVVFIGTQDLSFAMGYRGDQRPDAYQAALRRVRDAARANGKYVGRPVISAADVEYWHKEGFQFFQLPSDINMLRLGAEQLLRPLGRYAPAAPAKTLY